MIEFKCFNQLPARESSRERSVSGHSRSSSMERLNRQGAHAESPRKLKGGGSGLSQQIDPIHKGTP